MCVRMDGLVGGEAPGMHARMCVRPHFSYVFARAFVYFRRRLRLVLPQRKLLSGSLMPLIVCACLSVRHCMCECLCSLACADEEGGKKTQTGSQCSTSRALLLMR